MAAGPWSKAAALPELVRRLGARDAALYAIARLLGGISRGRCRLLKYRFVAQPIPDAELSGVRPGGSFRVRQVAFEDPVVARFPRPPAVIARRFRDGARCFVAEAKGEFAGFLWLQHGGYDEDEVRCRFVPLPRQDTVWDFDVHLEPEQRMGRGFVRLWDAAMADLRQRRVRWTMSRISAFNADSLRAHARLGAREVGSATFVCAGTWQLALFSSKPYVHFSRDDRSIPLLELHAPPRE